MPNTERCPHGEFMGCPRCGQSWLSHVDGACPDLPPDVSSNLFEPVHTPEVSENLVDDIEGFQSFKDLPPHTDVVTWGNSAWPAWRMPGGIIVDLRLFDPHGDATPDYLIYRPEKLAEAGVPDAVIVGAAQSTPEGFVFLQC